MLYFTTYTFCSLCFAQNTQEHSAEELTYGDFLWPRLMHFHFINDCLRFLYLHWWSEHRKPTDQPTDWQRDRHQRWWWWLVLFFSYYTIARMVGTVMMRRISFTRWKAKNELSVDEIFLTFLIGFLEMLLSFVFSVFLFCLKIIKNHHFEQNIQWHNPYSSLSQWRWWWYICSFFLMWELRSRSVGSPHTHG